MTEQEEREWLERVRAKYSWMSDDQWACYLMLCELFLGAHHFDGKVKDFGRGIQMSTTQDFSTFDFDRMTRAVFLAHDRCIRMEITSSGPGMIRLCLWKRHSREDSEIWDRHPTIETALARYRERKPKPKEATG